MMKIGKCYDFDSQYSSLFDGYYGLVSLYEKNVNGYNNESTGDYIVRYENADGSFTDESKNFERGA